MKTFTPKDRSEVELRITQEIKNHKDWMYDIGQKIQSLSEHLISLSISHEKVISKSDSERKETLISFENFQEKVVKKIDDFFQRLGDLESRCSMLQLLLGDKLYEHSNLFITKENHNKDLLKQIDKLDILLNIVKTNQDFIDTEFVQVRSQLKEQIENTRKEIPSVDEFKPLKKKMEDTFQAFNINFAGLVKEIELLKKSVAYDQKKFENIYTLIERLKEHKDPHVASR